MTECRRTHGMIDRVVDDEVTVDDRAHAVTCASCGPVLARAVRFEAELARATQRLVVEELPAGILEAGLAGQVVGPRPARGVPFGLATAGAAVAVLVLATAVALAPPPGANPTPGAGPTPTPTLGRTFQTTIEIVSQAIALEYTCSGGQRLPTSGPSAGLAVRESAVCHTPEGTGALTAAIIVGESADGEVVTVWMKSNVTGSDSADARNLIAQRLAKLTFLSLRDPATARTAGDFVAARLPQLDTGNAGASIETGGVLLLIERREDGLYLVTLEPGPAG